MLWFRKLCHNKYVYFLTPNIRLLMLLFVCIIMHLPNLFRIETTAEFDAKKSWQKVLLPANIGCASLMGHLKFKVWNLKVVGEPAKSVKCLYIFLLPGVKRQEKYPARPRYSTFFAARETFLHGQKCICNLMKLKKEETFVR